MTVKRILMTPPAVRRFRELLDTSLVSQRDLVEYLSTLTYTPAPDAPRDSTGYIPTPSRHMEATDRPATAEATERFQQIAQTCQLAMDRVPGWRGVDIVGVTLDAILRGDLVPVPPHTLAPPRRTAYTPTGKSWIRLSRPARLGIERMFSPHRTNGHAPQMSKLITQLSKYRYEWSSPLYPNSDRVAEANAHIANHPRQRANLSVTSSVIEHLAREGMRLGIRTYKGRRTPLALASNTLEAIGLGLLVPITTAAEVPA